MGTPAVRSVYQESRILRIVLGESRSGLRILLASIAWVIVLAASALWENAFSHRGGIANLTDPADVTFTEDLFTLSVVMVMGLVFYLSLMSFYEFEGLFLHAHNVTLAGGQGVSSDGIGESLDFINHRSGAARAYYIVLVLLCVITFALLASGYWFSDSSGTTWNRPRSLGGGMSLAFDFFLLVLVGPPLGWRMLATSYCAGCILDKKKIPLEIPYVIVSTRIGIGRAFRFAAMASAIPLSTAPALIIWLLTRGDLMIVWSIGAGAIIGTITLIAFLIPTTAAVSAVKKKRQEDLNRIDLAINSHLQWTSSLEHAEKENIETMMRWREALATDPVWPYGWLATVGLGVLAETMIAGLTSLF